MPMTRPLLLAPAVFIVGLIIFLIGIQTPAHPYFDEVHYLPAARELLLPGHPTLNREQPPLAKALIGTGIAIFGDAPLGWRAMSALFGALTLALVYLWALALFDDPAPSLFAATLTLADQFLYVQSRIATLDVFLAAFTTAALAAFTATWRPGAPVRKLMLGAAICLGLATACKWTGLFPAALCVATVLIVAILKQWRARFDAPRPDDWFRPDLWSDMRPRDWFVCALAPALVYAATFLPLADWSIPDLLQRQADMWHDQSTLSVADHPYASRWTTWPLLIRPIWYLFEPIPDTPGAFQAIICLGNPLIVWAALPAFLAALAALLRARDRAAFVILAAYAALYLAWALVPRGLGFLYYYFPAALTLGPALAFAFYRTPLRRAPLLRWTYLAAAVACFAYFLPITSASMTVTLPTYARLMWLETWR